MRIFKSHTYKQVLSFLTKEMVETPGSILTGGNVLLLNLILFSHSKACDATVANFIKFVKTLNLCAPCETLSFSKINNVGIKGFSKG